MRHTLRVLLPFVLLPVSTFWGMARQASANQDPAHPAQTKVESQIPAPKVKHWMNPTYTPEARSKGLQGTVKLHVFIAADGTVRRVEVIEGDPVLAEASAEAVKQWTFEPPTVDGKPVETDVTIGTTFRMLESRSCHVPTVLTAVAQGPTRVEGVMAPCLKSSVAPVYPPKAKNKHIEGIVRLHAIIAPDGSIKQLEVLQGEPILAESALKAVKRWTYEPLVLDGKPVEVETTVDVIFHLLN